MTDVIDYLLTCSLMLLVVAIVGSCLPRCRLFWENVPEYVETEEKFLDDQMKVTPAETPTRIWKATTASTAIKHEP